MRSVKISIRVAAILCLVFLFDPGPSAAVNQPFGAHGFAYAAGTILPNHVSAVVRDQAVRDFYSVWKARYLKQKCGTGRYVVETKTQRGNLTVSEGHGYGMIIAALMAGEDPDARTIFDGMYGYFTEHPTATHARLMSWYQNRSCTDALGNDSAADGDLDIAFALLLADKQWGSCGAVNYLAEANAVIADIKSGDLDASASYVLLGDWVVPSSTTYYPSTRTSDFLPDHYRSFAAATGDPAWSGLINATYGLIATMQANHSPVTGLLPDFVQDPLGTPAPAVPFFLEDSTDGDYAYNACRDPWRIGTDYLASGDTRARTALQKINTWIRSSTGGDPALIKSGYKLDGTSSENYPSMVFIAPLGVGAMVDAANQTWLNAVWDTVVATPLSQEDYYGNSLKLLSMIVMSGNWWAPDQVTSASCTPNTTTLCTDGGYLSNVHIIVSGLGKPAGRQSLRFRGKLFFPQGTPLTGALEDGAQLLVEDLGTGGSALLDLSSTTTPVPAQADGVCAARGDGWKVNTRTTIYRNRSTALDPPACTPGTSRGLAVLKYRTRSGLDLDFNARTRRSTIADAVGPLRGTIVLGKTAAAGGAGACAVTASVPCQRRGTRLRCP